jgi:hypothetical protein
MTTIQNTAEPAAEATTETGSRRPIWIRGAFMLFFLFAFGIGQTLLAVTAVIQFLSLLITRQPNAFLTNFGRSLGQWLAQTSQFQSCASDERPFPWAPWPDAR